MFVEFRLMKNIIFNKPESYVGRNTYYVYVLYVYFTIGTQMCYFWFFIYQFHYYCICL